MEGRSCRSTRPTPCGPPILWADKRHAIDAKRLHVDRDFAGGLHRIAMEQRAGVMSQLRCFRDRLHDTGFRYWPA